MLTLDIYSAFKKNPKYFDAQKLTLDNDIRAIAKALWTAKYTGKRIVGVGVTCEVCGQEGAAYVHEGKKRIVLCDRVCRGLANLFDECRERTEGDRYKSSPITGMHVHGAEVEPIACGRSIRLDIMMRRCYFPEAA